MSVISQPSVENMSGLFIPSLELFGSHCLHGSKSGISEKMFSLVGYYFELQFAMAAGS